SSAHHVPPCPLCVPGRPTRALSAPLCSPVAMAPPEIFPLSLHAALPICARVMLASGGRTVGTRDVLVSRIRLGISRVRETSTSRDRKSTRLNSSHVSISYAVFCLKKKTDRHAAGCRKTVEKGREHDRSAR